MTQILYTILPIPILFWRNLVADVSPMMTYVIGAIETENMDHQTRHNTDCAHAMAALSFDAKATKPIINIIVVILAKPVTKIVRRPSIPDT